MSKLLTTKECSTYARGWNLRIEQQNRKGFNPSASNLNNIGLTGFKHAAKMIGLIEKHGPITNKLDYMTSQDSQQHYDNMK